MSKRGAVGFACAAVATLATLALHSQTAAAIAQNDTPYAATRLVARWRAIMNSTLEDSRAFAPETVIELMEIFVSPGAVRLIQDKASDEQVQRVDGLVQRFALAVVSAGDKQPDGSVILEESDVDTAERATCPVYPFCPQ